MRTKKATVNILFGFLGMLVTTFMGFISSSLFARNLGVEISGLNNLLLNIVSFLSVTELGIAGAINFNLYKPVAEKDYDTVSKIMTFYRKCYTIIGTVIAVVALIMSPFVRYLIKDTTLSNLYIQTTFLLCAANSVLSYFLAYNRNLLYAFQDNYLSSLVDLCFRIFFTALQIVSLIKLQNFHLHLFLNLIYTLITNIIITAVTKKRYSKVNTSCKSKDKKLERKVMSDVKSLAVIQVGSAMINFTDSIIISKAIGIIIAGMYSYYATLIQILTNLINTVFSNLGASIGNLLAEDEKNNIRRVFDILTHFCFILGLILASGMGNAVEPFIVFWVGKEFVIDYSVVFILAVNFYIMVQRQVVTYFLRTGGHHRLLVRPLIIEAVINLVISIILAVKVGLIGVFIGTVVSAIVGWILNSKTLCEVFSFNLKKYLSNQLMYMAVFIGGLIISHFVIDWLNLQCGYFIRFIISGSIAITIPVIVAITDILFNPILLSIKEMIRNLILKICRKT